MDNMATEPKSSPNPVKRSSLSPTFEQLSYLDAEPYIQDIYDMSSNTRHSPYMGQLSAPTEQTEDPFQQGAPSSFVPSSTSSDGTWDEYIAWDSLRSDMDLDPGWLSQTPQEQSNAPLFDDPSWQPLQQPESSSSAIPGGNSKHFAPEQNTLPINQAAQADSMDGMGDFLMHSGSTYPSLPTKSNFSRSQSTPTPAQPQDSGFASHSTSHTGRPSLDLIVPTATLSRSGSQSPIDSSTRSPTKRRPSLESQAPDFKKPRKGKSTAHNDVERRYRTNLNARIAELSNSVPSLRRATASENASGDEMDMEPRSGYPSRGLKKATIMSKATEYIKTLEGERRGLEEENSALRERLALCGRIAGEEGLE